MIELPDLTQLKQKRMALGITQKELASISGVGQPLISRIEDGTISKPSYYNVRKIFEAFNDIEQRADNKGNSKAKPITASDIMNADVISVSPNSKVAQAWAIMKENGFSQLPVIDTLGRVVGKLSESSLIVEAKTAETLQENQVEDVMGDSFPTVGRNTPVTSLGAFLRNTSAVIVTDRGRVVGIITRYDLVEHFHRTSRLK
jgi:predicted transcriptional regulator